MKKIKIEGVNEIVYHEVMKNGLNVYLLPNKNVKSYYLTFNTRFGSINTEFKFDGTSSYTKVPNGVAHFLEHLAFKMEKGDASDYFANLGSFSNAYTSYKVTCYEVFGFDKFKQNLEYLLDFVQTPYFNQKLVEGEKGIITEEIKMYKDDPTINLSFEMYKNLFHNDHRKYLISGEVEDIKKITLKDIESSYKTFYNPSNMFVIITGNFNPEEALAIIEENQSKKQFASISNIKQKSITEPKSVVKEYAEIPSNVEIDKVNIGLKIPLSSFNSLKLDPKTRNIYIAVILNSMFGVSSEIRERLISGNIITDGLAVERFFTDDYLIVNLLAETPYPQRYISIMKEVLKNINITESDLERKKKVAISNFILAFDNIEEINASIQSDIINYGEVVTDIYNLYNNLDYEIAKKVASKIVDKNMAIVVLTANKNK